MRRIRLIADKSVNDFISLIEHFPCYNTTIA